MSADLRTYYDRKALEIDELAATYNSPIPYKRFFYRRRFEAVMALLDPRPGERILELGCGSGFYTKPLIESGAVVTASDLAANYVAQAQQHVGALAGKATFRVEDVQGLTFPDGQFDKILMTEVIEHVPAPERALAQAHRALRVGGILVVSTPSRFSPLNLAYALKRRVRGYGFNEHVHEFSIGGFRRLVASRFEIEEIAFANLLLPYPLDLAAAKLGQRSVSGLERLERLLTAAPLVRRLAWTVVVRARKD